MGFRNPAFTGLTGYPYKLGDGKKQGAVHDGIEQVQTGLALLGYTMTGAYTGSVGVFDKQTEMALA